MLRLLKMLFCRHTHGRLVAIEWDGTAVYECMRCGKLVNKPPNPQISGACVR